MAVRRRTSRVPTSSTYSTYGSVAYAPAYDGSSARVPRRDTEPKRPGSRQQNRHRTYERTQPEVREAGKVAPFAVISFLAIAALGMMLLLSRAQYLEVTNDIVKLNSEKSTLESQYATMSAEYERLYDLSSIEEAVGADMVRPTGDQVVYIDLSEPDTVTVFGAEGEENPVVSFFKEISESFRGLVSYFG